MNLQGQGNIQGQGHLQDQCHPNGQRHLQGQSAPQFQFPPQWQCPPNVQVPPYSQSTPQGQCPSQCPPQWQFPPNVQVPTYGQYTPQGQCPSQCPPNVQVPPYYQSTPQGQFLHQCHALLYPEIPPQGQVPPQGRVPPQGQRAVAEQYRRDDVLNAMTYTFSLAEYLVNVQKSLKVTLHAIQQSAMTPAVREVTERTYARTLAVEKLASDLVLSSIGRVRGVMRMLGAELQEQEEELRDFVQGVLKVLRDPEFTTV